MSWWCHPTILCHPRLLPSIFLSIMVFSNELALCIRWPKYWSRLGAQPTSLISLWFENYIMEKPKQGFQSKGLSLALPSRCRALSKWLNLPVLLFHSYSDGGDQGVLDFQVICTYPKAYALHPISLKKIRKDPPRQGGAFSHICSKGSKMNTSI